jgi:hypothetical protein
MPSEMRTRLILVLSLLTSGCLAPGERDPTRYPWDQPHPLLQARGALEPWPQPLLPPPPPQGLPSGTYCVIALEPAPKSGITVGGKAPGLACSVAVPAQPPKH